MVLLLYSAVVLYMSNSKFGSVKVFQYRNQYLNESKYKIHLKEIHTINESNFHFVCNKALQDEFPLVFDSNKLIGFLLLCVICNLLPNPDEYRDNLDLSNLFGH